jgi:hypothetical protein
VIELITRRVALALCAILLSGAATFAQSLPPGWATADIGAVGATGSASGSGDAITASGAGADIWGSSDAFRFVYTSLTGDGTIVTQVKSAQYIADWTKAGVMLRASLSPSAAQATMLVSANKGLAFQRRVSAGGASTHTAGASARAPYFVRLTRSGNNFTAAQSIDGTSWVTVGTETIVMPATIYAGVVISSHVSGTLATATFAATVVSGSTPPPSPATTETIVFLRHGEKPTGGYGQITCQGLQRALALPAVLIGRFGTPNAIFAPNPVPQVTDAAGSFYYVRPLATIEPTAIRLGLPVNAQYGFTDIAGLQGALLGSAYENATVFVAWEHLKLQEVVQNIISAYGDGAAVPAWPSGDYDSLYVVTVTRSGGSITAQFAHDYEGLNNLPVTCP